MEAIYSRAETDYRFKRWADSANDINFISPEAKLHYTQSVKRFIDVFNVREPDRIPVSVNPGVIPFYLEGFDYNSAIHNPEMAFRACLKFNIEYAAQLDSFALPFMIPAKSFESLIYKLYSWPGFGLPANGTGIQFLEGEYMMADEYDALILNPSDFWMRTYLPRIFGVFESFRNLSPLSDIVEFPVTQFKSLADPDVRSSLRKLIEVGDELDQFGKLASDFGRIAQENGYPLFPPLSSFTKAPFDTLGDTLRGTQGIMKDMYRQPEKLLKAMDVIADLTIDSVLHSSAPCQTD